MIDFIKMTEVFIAGLLSGGLFFAGLFWTVKQGLMARHPALWFLGSWLIRVAVVLSVFIVVSAGQWERLLVCTAGFFIARVVMIRIGIHSGDAGYSRTRGR